MSKLKELALMVGLASLNTPFIGSSAKYEKAGFKKSMMPSKDYVKRKKRLKISGRSRNINHRLAK